MRGVCRVSQGLEKGYGTRATSVTSLAERWVVNCVFDCATNMHVCLRTELGKQDNASLNRILYRMIKLNLGLALL